MKTYDIQYGTDIRRVNSTREMRKNLVFFFCFSDDLNMKPSNLKAIRIKVFGFKVLNIFDRNFTASRPHCSAEKHQQQRQYVAVTWRAEGTEFLLVLYSTETSWRTLRIDKF